MILLVFLSRLSQDGMGKAYVGQMPVGMVPEPATYALMLGGLGLVGLMARRRKQA